MLNLNVKKMVLRDVFGKAYGYCRNNLKRFVGFSLGAFLSGVLVIASWDSLWLWPVLLLVYVVWGGFFRYYFNRKPYFEWSVFFRALVPSSKVMVLSVVVGVLLIVLPFVPLFVSTSPEFNTRYAYFLQGDIEGVEMLLLLANIMFLMVSPVIVYRPFLAWIAALLGRSGSLRLAWDRTKGNYGEFLVIAVLVELIIWAIDSTVSMLGGNEFVVMLVASPVVVFFNILSAKLFEFFFLDVE